MSYAKIEDGISKGLPADAACSNKHKLVPWSDKLWFFSAKPVTNPSRPNCTNYESFQGGYTAIHELPGWTYKAYPQVLDYNYAQDFIFPIKDQMFMFVYSKFDGFYFYGLYYWCSQSGQWKDATLQKEGDYSMARNVDCSVVQCSPADQSVAYVVLVGKTTDHLKVFQFKRNEQWENYVEMTAICSIDNATGFATPHLLHACVYGTKIYCLLGTSDAAVNTATWDQTQVLEICLQTKKATVKEIQGGADTFPPFPAGPLCAVHDGGPKWLIICGKISDEAFSRDVWYFDLDETKWHRTCQPIPDDVESSEMVAGQMGGVLFLADKTKIYNYPTQNYTPFTPAPK